MRAGRLPEPSGDLRQDAIAELRWAMAGAGLTVDKLPLMASVLALPVVSRALAGVPKATRPRVAFDALVAAARELGDGLQARVLRNSLGVGYRGDGKDLTARREELARTHNTAVREAGGRNLVAESPRALYDMEQEMLGAIVTALGAPAGVSEPAGLPMDAAALTWTCGLFDITYRLRGRAGVESESLYVAKSLVEGLEDIRLAYGSGNDQDPGTFELLEGGTVVDDRALAQPGFRSVLIRLPRPLRLGDTQRLRFDVRYPPSTDSYFTVQVTRPNDRITVRVSFDRTTVPRRVWRVAGLLPDARGEELDECRLLDLDPIACVETSFEHPPVSYGYGYGVAWDW